MVAIVKTAEKVVQWDNNLQEFVVGRTRGRKDFISRAKGTEDEHSGDRNSDAGI